MVRMNVLMFYYVKDHKPNFKNNPKVRMINPAKNEIAWISKNILNKTNHQLRHSLRIDQWKDTSEVIEWFLKIPDKNRHKPAIFDINDFYPSKSEKLLTNALEFSKEIADINREHLQIMYTSENHFCLVTKNLGWKEKETFWRHYGSIRWCQSLRIGRDFYLC